MNNKKQINWTLMIVIALAIFIWSMYRGTKPTVTPPFVSPITTPVITPKSTAIEDSFMEGCLESGVVTRVFCSCAYDELLKKYTIGEVVDLYDIEPDGVWLNEIIDACS